MTKTKEINLDNPFNMPEFAEGDAPLERALTNVMATAEGRTLIWAILSQTKIYDENFAGNSADIFDKGRRSVGLWLIAQLNETDPTIYPRMLLDVARQGLAAEKLANQQEQDR
jgi:hypothetical protein